MVATRRRASGPSWFDQNEARAQQVLKDLQKQRAQGKQRTLKLVIGNQPEAIRQLLDNIKAGRPFRLPTTGICTSFKEEILDGIHLAADTYKIALYVSASTISPSTTAYTATNEVANGAGYTTGGVTLAGRQIVTDGTTKILDWTTDPVWAAASITARGALIYNSTRSNKAVAVFDFGADIISTSGNFTVTLPAPTAAAGAIRIA